LIQQKSFTHFDKENDDKNEWDVTTFAFDEK